MKNFRRSMIFELPPNHTPPVLIELLAQASREVRVQFAQGKSSTQLSGQVQGYQTIDYLLKANAKQKLSVEITSNNRFTMMGIYTPTGEELCVETCGNSWSGILPNNGDYRVRLGLIRAEARRNGKTNYTMNIKITSP